MSVDRIALTRRETAVALGFSEKTVYELTRRGELPCVRFGARGVRYPVSVIQRYIDEKLAATSK